MTQFDQNNHEATNTQPNATESTNERTFTLNKVVKKQHIPWILGSGIIVLIVIGILIWPSIFGDSLQPQQVVTNYCQALASHDYTRAYSYLNLQIITDNSPTSAQSLQDLSDQLYHGVVQNCDDVTDRTTTQFGGVNMAQVDVTMQFTGTSDAGYSSVDVYFFLETFHNSWKITNWWIV
jgi:hypothetical protein